MNPSQRLKIFEVGVFGHLVRQGHILIGTYLRNHNDGPNLLDIRIVWGTDSIHIACNLDPQIADADESFKNILRQYVCVARFLEIVRVHINVIRPQVKTGG
jgi:hypothetical protein